MNDPECTATRQASCSAWLSLRRIKMRKPVLVAFLTSLALTYAVDAGAQSGQRAFGQSTVEPAINDADGSTVFLLTPDKVPFPSQSNPRAAAPMYIPMYPVGSTIHPTALNCQPNNCDHLNVLPFAAPGYPNGGTTCT